MFTQKILKNASYLFFGNISVRFIVAVVTILFARYIGPKEYGIFSVAIAFSSIVGYFTDSGLSNTFMREATKENANLSHLISSYLRVRLILAVIATLLSYFLIDILYDDQYLISIINWIVYPTIFGATLQGVGIVFFQAKERMQFSSGIMVIQGITTSLAIFLGVMLNYPLTVVSIMYGGASLVTGTCAILLVLRYSSLHKGWNNAILSQLISFTINGIIIIILPHLGPIILEKVSSLGEVGFFSTAYKIPAVLYQIPGVIAVAFYPKLFAFGNNSDTVNHRKLSQLELKLMSFIGVFIAIPFILNPEFWIVSLLGVDWQRASVALSILSFMIILQSINYALADYLTTIGLQSKRTLIMAIGLLVAISAYTILGYNFGMIGGAFAGILTEVTLLVGFCFCVEKGIHFLVKGISVNILGFIFCVGIYELLPQNEPLILLPLIMIIFVVIVSVIDKQIRLKIREAIAKLNRY
jgi:O-antigen/teichoic acid export membrane protein